MPLYKWQAKEIEEHAFDLKRAIFAAPRTGKTLCAIECAVKALSTEKFPDRKLLIIAPLVVCPMWMEEFAKRGLEVFPAYKLPTAIVADQMTCSDIIVINWDRLAVLESVLKTWPVDYVIADESHKAKGVSSKQGKAFRRICWKAKYVRLLTGTPAPNHYGDLWGQMVALDKDVWLSSYTKFSQRYLITDDFYKSKVLGYNNLAELQSKLSDWSTIVRREDVFGPDTYQEVVRTVHLPSKVQSTYRRLAREWILDPARDGISLDASHILTRLTRLQQLTSGYLPDEESKAYQDLHKTKIYAILADLEEIIESGEKVVVYHRFTHEGTILFQAINAKYQTYKIDGRVPADTRQVLATAFNENEGPCVMVAQTQSAGIGISLKEATYAMFASLDFSFADHEQARDRVFNPGQHRCVHYYIAEGTIDQHIYNVISSKKMMHQAIQTSELESIVFGGAT